jgi:HD-GYP domain-containing protein (c-di-GMP phosphodiesterase class II)
MELEDAIRELRRNAGTQFDLEIVETFLTCLAAQAAAPADA